MSNSIKNQHYVPQFYLNYFANNEKKIFVYDKFNLIAFSSNSRSISSERYFYDLLKGEVQMIETDLNAKFEVPFSIFLPILIKKLNTHNYFKLKKYEKIKFASFLSYQYLRTKRFREESVRLFTSTNIYLSAPHYSPLIGHISLLTDNNLQKDIFNKLLNDYYWIFGKNSTDKLFYTSDHPFVQRYTIHQLHLINDRDTSDFTLLSDELSFPITPKLNVTLYKKNKIFKKLKKYNGKVLDVSLDNVDWYNEMQVMKSYRQVYSQNNDFSFIKELEVKRREFLIKSGVSPNTIKTP